VTTAERLGARWDEEIDLVATTVELDERTILIAVGRRLQLSHFRIDLLEDLRGLRSGVRVEDWAHRPPERW
jgi:hypothetical protein